MRTSRSDPTGRISWYSAAWRSFCCTACDAFPTSSRNSVPPFADAKMTNPIATCIGERARDVSEEFRSRERVIDRTQHDYLIGTRGPWRSLVEVAGHPGLAGSRLAFEKHSRRTIPREAFHAPQSSPVCLARCPDGFD